MRHFIQSLSGRAEYAIVLLSAFGYLVFSNVVLLLHPTAIPPISQRHLVFLLVYESVILLLLCAFLHMRGWTMKSLGIRPTAKDTLIGVGLAVAVYVAYVLVWWAASAAGMHATYAGNNRELADRSLTLPAVIGVSLLNPIFEETFLCGYIVTTAKRMNRAVAGVNISVAIRLSYHLYQGGIGVLGIIPVGLIFAWWYARSGRLWPVLVAHALFDATGLLQFVGKAS
jgi:uncharacterized protein